jgi:O-antigen/teichoic acid export membrane protein
MLVIVFYGEWILGLYGGTYIEAYWSLVIFSAGVSVYTILIIWRPLLQYIGKEKQVMIIMAITTFIAICAMVVAGSYWAELGVSIVAGGVMAMLGVIFAISGHKALLSRC